MTNLHSASLFRCLKISIALAVLSVLGCAQENEGQAHYENVSPYLFLFAGDMDAAHEDFLMVLDVAPESPTFGKPVSSLPIGHKNSMPHHMEYVPPPKGEPIFMNAHRAELSMIVDITDPTRITIKKKFMPPEALRFPHDYTRTTEGNRLVGFLRSEGKSPDVDE